MYRLHFDCKLVRQQTMIQCIAQIEISVSQRFDHLTTLVIDSQNLPQLVREQDKKRTIVRNFRIIKSSQKVRMANEQRYLKYVLKVGRKLNKNQIIACENMFANCMNQYLNSDYQVKKSGDPNDLIDIFLFYYHQIQANSKIKELTVVKNCHLFYEINFMHDNLTFFLSNIQTSLKHVYQSEKNKFFTLTKTQNRSLSPPERREEEQQIKFDATGKIPNKDKRKLQQYCYQLSGLLDLESIYVNYFYFNSMDSEKRKRALMSNYLKRNVHIKRLLDSYQTQYRSYKQKCKK